VERYPGLFEVDTPDEMKEAADRIVGQRVEMDSERESHVFDEWARGLQRLTPNGSPVLSFREPYGFILTARLLLPPWFISHMYVPAPVLGLIS